MKILHLSDLHFGKSPFKRDIYSFQKNFCGGVSDFVKGNGIGTLLISGDIYDTSTASSAAVSLWDHFMRLMILDCRIPVFVISGNHDGSERLSVCSDILSAQGLYIRGSLEGFDTPVPVGDCDIYMLPFFEKGHMENILSQEFENIDAAYSAALDRIRSRMDGSRRNIIMSHCFAAGGIPSESETSAELISPAGTLNAVSVQNFKGFDYAALGHIHRPQTLKCEGDDVIVRYCGTPMKYSFSETCQTKTFSIYDSESNTLETAEIPEYIRFGISAGSYDEVREKAAEYKSCDFVRIELNGENSELSAADLRGLYPAAVQIVSSERRASHMSLSGITDDDIMRMDIPYLAEKYLKEYYGMDITDEQKEWLSQAVRLSEKEEPSQ